MFKDVGTKRRVGRARNAVRAVAEAMECRTLLSTYLVTNANDSGPNSLRDALTQSNANPGTPTSPNTINFAIGSGQQIITVASPLPAISAPVIINGATQPGHTNSPLIEINGYGLSISSGNSSVIGLDIISQNGGPLITIGQNGNNTIQGNWLGIDLTGNAAAGNGEYGIYCDSGNNLIGGTSASQRNVISGITAIAPGTNTAGSAGIYLFGLNAVGDTVEGNYIGTNASGNAAVGSYVGVEIDNNANHNVVGGTAAGAGNLISGNLSRNLLIQGAAVQNQILGNIIGLNAAGTSPLLTSTTADIDVENSKSNIIGSTAAGARNILSGANYGVYVFGFGGTQGAFNTIQGNYIGTDITGTVAIGNSVSGVVLQSQSNTLGGTSASARNIVSGNLVGVTIDTLFNAVQGNYIGLNVNGAALGNTGNGVIIGGSGAVVGGTASGARNIISGNGNGILVNFAGGVIQGNYIGTDPTGATAVPNVSNGILIASQSGTTIGGTTAAARNVISGNALNGIKFTGTNSNTGTVIQGNYIGLNAAGTGALGNGAAGITIQGPAQTLIGGASGAANVIANNNADGVDITTSTATGNAISQNSIYNNGGLGIDLGADGITPNHTGGAISGPNNLINHPVISSVVFGSSSTTVAGSFNSDPSANFTLEFFASPSGSGTMQGKTYLGNTIVTTDASGSATFNVSTLAQTAAGQSITATATDAAGDTSEFSLPATVASPAVAARQIFYNNSIFDGNNPAANVNDDNAIAPGKQALLPGGGTASFANYTSYSKGINGIEIDVANLAGIVKAADFSFVGGNTATPSLWTSTFTPTSVAVRVGAGTSGSSRIDITFADGSILNQWLKITVNADANTGLTSPDVFYFGNLVGQAGDAPSNGVFSVSSADVTSAQNDPQSYLNPTTISDVNDFNRDSRVDATDELFARNNIGSSLIVLQPLSGSATPAAQPVNQPTSLDVYMAAIINWIRANPTAAAAQYGINLNEGLSPGTISSTPKPPLAINGSLTQAATQHSQWMLANQTFSHNEGTLDPPTRMANAGYVFTSPSGSAENIAARGTNNVLIPTQIISQEMSDLFLDSSTTGRTHRLNLLNANFEDVGVGLATGTFMGTNSILATQDFAFSASSGPYLTGIAYTDARIHDNFYEPGEGLGGITITAVRTSDNTTFSTTTVPAGAYSLALPAGTYTVTASGSGLGGTITRQNVTIGSQNIEQDFTPATGSYIAGRFVFYNNSVFDGNNTAQTSADDIAIATDKQALLPGVPSSFVNYTSYSKGINGIMVDFGNLPPNATPALSDFVFKVGNTSTPASWTTAPAPIGFSVRPGFGTGGTTRVEITWADGAIKNTWLQVNIGATINNGLLASDTFYFGNAIGSSGDTPTSAAVTLDDPVVTRSNTTGYLTPATITDPYDYNRDGRVDATDELIARNNIGSSVIFFTPPDPNDSTTSTAQSAVTGAAPATSTTSAAPKKPHRASLAVRKHP